MASRYYAFQHSRTAIENINSLFTTHFTFKTLDNEMIKIHVAEPFDAVEN